MSRDDPPDRRRRRDPPGPVPTLAQLRRGTCWLWLYCRACPHSAPAALAPLIIRWGANASSDTLRRRARCMRCGGKGAMLMHPSWGDSQMGLQPFPAGRMTKESRTN